MSEKRMPQSLVLVPKTTSKLEKQQEPTIFQVWNLIRHLKQPGKCFMQRLLILIGDHMGKPVATIHHFSALPRQQGIAAPISGATYQCHSRQWEKFVLQKFEYFGQFGGSLRDRHRGRCLPLFRPSGATGQGRRICIYSKI